MMARTMRSGVSLLAAFASAPCAAVAAPPEWFVYVLAPNSGGGSAAYAVGGGVVAGEFRRPTGQVPRFEAAVWTALSPWNGVNLHVPGASFSRVSATTGAQHVGLYATENDKYRAALWAGSPPQLVELHNAAFPETAAQGTDGAQQVGAGYISRLFTNFQAHAVVWSGSAGSMIDLHPPQGFSSSASGVSRGVQVGAVLDTNGQQHAGFWRGSAATWTDIHPGGDYWYSQAADISPDARVIAGNATYRSFTTAHACIWTGSPPVFVDLHPPGPETASYAAATTDDAQAGYTVGEFSRRAGVWRGTAQSFTNLSAVLPPEYRGFASANDISRDARGLWVAGSALSEVTGRYAAVAWARPDCYPDFDASTGRSALDIFDYLAFANAFEAQDVLACDCDQTTGRSVCDVFDYLCFANAFDQGCR